MTMTDNQQNSSKTMRAALILSHQTLALCPIEGACVSTVGEGRTERQVKCGHYQGSITNGKGSQIVCGYQEPREWI